MDIWSPNRLILFLAFVIPGFVSLKAYELLFPSMPKDSSKRLIDAIVYSCINYALLFWPIYEVETSQLRSSHPSVYFAFYFFALFIVPVVLVVLLRVVRTNRFLQRWVAHPTPRPWDYVFSQCKSFWVIVTLKDGRTVAGRYHTASFASSAPSPEELYLEEVWLLNQDGGFERARIDSAGIIILAPNIVTVEFFNLTYGDVNDDEEANQ